MRSWLLYFFPIIPPTIEWLDFVWYLGVLVPPGTNCWTGTKLLFKTDTDNIL